MLPNILLFVFDALRRDHLVDAVMPRTDAVAKQGIRYLSAYTDVGVTDLSASMMIYGINVLGLGCDAPQFSSLPERLGDNYSSLAVLASGLLCNPTAAQLWTTFDTIWKCTDDTGEPYRYRPYLYPEKALGAFRELIWQQPQPWFAYFHVFPVHDPYRGDDGEYVEIDPSHPGLNAERYQQYCTWADTFYAPLLEEHVASGGLLVVTSDHGEALGNNGRFGHGEPRLWTLPSVREIPLAVVGPGIEPIEEETPISNAEVPRLICQSLGLHFEPILDMQPKRYPVGNLPPDGKR